MPKYIPIPEITSSDWKRLARHIIFPPDHKLEIDCWLCDLKGTKGYPNFTIGGKKYRASRVILAWEKGDNPDLDAGHEKHEICGNRNCVSPCHLLWQTHHENNNQKKIDGTISIGEKHGRSNLTENQVKAIRDDYASGEYTQKQLAVKYNVIKQRAISDVVNHKTWKHI